MAVFIVKITTKKADVIYKYVSTWSGAPETLVKTERKKAKKENADVSCCN